MGRSEEWAAIGAKRALLRQQTEFLGEELPWLSDPERIPAHAAGDPTEAADLRLALFSLGSWMLLDMVQAADRIRDKLDWQGTLRRYKVAPHLEDRVLRAVLEPGSRHAPGISAMAEIVAAIPIVATRASIARGDWRAMAGRAERFAARLSRDGTCVQVIVRDYLAAPPAAEHHDDLRSLDCARLRLDEATAISPVTPINDLVVAARKAVTKHIGPARGTCVALQAAAPDGGAHPRGQTMYGAIWSAYAAAADRLVFPCFDAVAAQIPPQADPDPGFTAALDRLARNRAAGIRAGAVSGASPAAERVIDALVRDAVRCS